MIIFSDSIGIFFCLEFNGHGKKIQTNFGELLLSIDNITFRNFSKKLILFFLKIKENISKCTILGEDFHVNNFGRDVDMPKILNNTFHSEKVVFKDTCRWVKI
jgi:hypothetical protein